MEVLISVVTATKDRPRELARAYASLMRQTHTHWEWVVVDDASHAPYLRDLAASDSRIRAVYHESPEGKGPTRNNGLEQATGAWVTFLDDDDELVPDALAMLVAMARSRDFASHIYKAGILLQDAPGRRRRAKSYYRTEDPWVSALFAVTNIGGYLAPTQLARVVGFRNTRYFQDGDFILRLACLAPIIEIDAAAYVYHRYGASGSAEAYASRVPDEVLHEELSALVGLFAFDHPLIEYYRDKGIHELAIAARHVMHATSFPSVGLLATARAAYRSSRKPIVTWWLLRLHYLRLERRAPLLARARAAIGRGLRVLRTTGGRRSAPS